MQLLLMLALAAWAQGRPAFMIVKVEPAEARPGQTVKVTAELRDERHQRWKGKAFVALSVLGGPGEVNRDMVSTQDGRAEAYYQAPASVRRGESVKAMVRAAALGVWNQAPVTTTAPRIGP